MHKYLCSVLLAALLAISPLQAAETNLQQVQEQIESFKQSENSEFAPQTLKRANAYLGAAMLAEEQEKTDDVKAALEQAAEKLSEARQTAAGFKKRFHELLELRTAATASTQIITSSGQALSDLSPTQTIADADKELALAIATHEQGQLNRTQKHAGIAKGFYMQVLDKTLPWLTDLTASAVAKAAAAGGKQYAPAIYQAAKDKLAELRAYSDGISSKAPQQPEQALYLAREAKHIVDKVKAWRKRTSSHEMIILKDRKFRLKLAEELDIAEQSNPMLARINDRDLLKAVKKLKTELAEERLAHKQDVARLNKAHKEELESKLSARSDELKQAQQSQMTNIKEAFQAKLERETFEKKRQQRLRELFKDGEAEILVNLDGSLLIRMVGLKFATARSKIDSQYFDLIGRLKTAMDIYQERSLRIEGHTDNHGDVKPNQVLSLKRAEAVRDFLIAAGADGSRLKALGYGEVRPIASNEFPQGRAMNRRIDIVINAPQ